MTPHTTSHTSPETLQCGTCKETFPVTEFRKRTTLKNGSPAYDKRCKRCNAIRARLHRQSAKGRFVVATHVAKRRKIPWNITPEQYAELSAKPCHYCGFPLPPEGVGLDRLDPYGDYSVSNVVPCCTECNLTRGVWYSPDEMLMIGEVVRKIKSNRIANNLPVQLHQGWGRPRIHDY